MIFLFYLRVRSGQETSKEIVRIRSGLGGVEGHRHAYWSPLSGSV